MNFQPLLELNLEYYKQMVELYPDEDVWKRALRDTEKLLEEGKAEP